MAQARSRLSGGERAVIVVSLVLVAAFAVLLSLRLTGNADPGPASATTAPPATSGPAATATAGKEATEPAGEDLSEVSWDFVSPTGNIACAVDAERALCGIASFEYADQIPAAVVQACDGTVGHFLQVTAEGSSLVCDTSGEALTIDAAGVPALGYGQEESAEGFTCASAETGMSCRHDQSGYSFSVRRAAYDLA
ncbi:hypothetical protein KZX45_08615 [Georgenia sp. EYE_87]|uniref:hypothetical protein n=1 Tax=Georgenia sp. EYE_87 TaxID=2853448 RepID=UPI002002E632|nr:hypothetical protein [Georgenia sp. EYE_87]MCK6210602.1 hypothetical protein [Georgenia sp. EYE_87]